MAIRFKLFRSPRIFEEFVDKIRKKGYNEVDVLFAEHDGKFLYISRGVLKSGDVELLLPIHYGFRPNMGSINKAGRDALVDMVNSAEKLEKCGLKYNVKGDYTIEQLRYGLTIMNRALAS